MKITRNFFRLKVGIVLLLLGVVMLAITDWNYLRTTYSFPWDLLGSSLHRHRLRYDPNATPLFVAVMMIFASGCVALEFKGDPPPGKDPWEE